jgi:hemoglobin
MRNTARIVTLVALGLALALVVTPATISGQAKPDSLYKRLGGYDAIAAVVDNFVPRLVKDPVLAKYFVHSQDTLMHIRQLAVDQICAVTGGPCVYIGRDMKTAHKGLGITSGEWDMAVKHLVATLDQFKVPAAEKDELLKVVGTLRADIVEK